MLQEAGTESEKPGGWRWPARMAVAGCAAHSSAHLPSSSHHSQECPFMRQLDSFHPRLWIKVCQSRKEGKAAELRRAGLHGGGRVEAGGGGEGGTAAENSSCSLANLPILRIGFMCVLLRQIHLFHRQTTLLKHNHSCLTPRAILQRSSLSARLGKEL